jgi:carbon monoxide dehydrogenase subunit G
MTTYESKTVAIKRRSEDVYKLLSDFSQLSQFIPKDKVEGWQAEADWCKFHVKGVGQLGLKIIEREPNKTIKITGQDNKPFEFYIWIQIKEVEPYDTRMKITLKSELNMMMKMLLNKQLEEGIHNIADQIANAFNRGV